MFRPTTIALALMSGGALVSIAPALMRDRCAEARANHVPNAEAICTSGRSGGYGGGHGGWWYASSGTTTHTGTIAVSTTGVSRGGFGATGAAHASAGG